MSNSETHQVWAGTAAVPSPTFILMQAINSLTVRLEALEKRFETLDVPETDEQS